MAFRISRYRCGGFVDPASLITMGVLLVALVGTFVASKLLEQSSENRGAAVGGALCKSEGGTCVPGNYTCQTTLPANGSDCDSYSKCGINCWAPNTTPPPAPTTTPAPTSTPFPPPSNACVDNAGKCVLSTALCTPPGTISKICLTGQKCVGEAASCVIPTLTPTAPPPTLTPKPTAAPPTTTPIPSPTLISGVILGPCNRDTACDAGNGYCVLVSYSNSGKYCWGPRTGPNPGNTWAYFSSTFPSAITPTPLPTNLPTGTIKPTPSVSPTISPLPSHFPTLPLAAPTITNQCTGQDSTYHYACLGASSCASNQGSIITSKPGCSGIQVCCGTPLIAPTNPPPAPTIRPSPTPLVSPMPTATVGPSPTPVKCTTANHSGCLSPTPIPTNTPIPLPTSTPRVSPTPTPVMCTILNPSACFAPRPSNTPQPTSQPTTSPCSGQNLGCMSAFGCSSMNGMVVTSHSCAQGGLVCCSLAPPIYQPLPTLMPTITPTPSPASTAIPTQKINSFNDPLAVADYYRETSIVVAACQQTGAHNGDALEKCFCDHITGGCPSGSIAIKVADKLNSLSTSGVNPGNINCVEYVCALSYAISATVCSYNAHQASELTTAAAVSFISEDGKGMKYCLNSTGNIQFKPGDYVIYPGTDGHIAVCVNNSDTASPTCQLAEANIASPGTVTTSRIVTSKGVQGVWRTTSCY